MFERENRTERFYDLADAPDLRVGIEKAVRYAREHGHETVVVVVPTLERAQDLAPVLGTSPARDCANAEASGSVRSRWSLERSGTCRYAATRPRLSSGLTMTSWWSSTTGSRR